MELRSRYDPRNMGGEEGVIAWEGGVGHRGNNICTGVGDTMSSVVWVTRYGGARYRGGKSFDDVKLRSTQSSSW